MARITILHTGDFHGELSAQAAKGIRRLKSDSVPALLLDAGDAVSAGNVGVRWSGEEILRRMNEAGYDALAMGNREFHPWRLLLRKKLANASFPVLCANLREPKSAGVESCRLFEVGGIGVAVFGLCVPMIVPTHWARRISPFVFNDPISSAAALVPKLRAEASVVVALTHIGIDVDRQLAESVPGIDLVLGGHSHVAIRDDQPGRPPILHAASHGREIGKAVLEVRDGRVDLVSWERIPLDSGREGD